METKLKEAFESSSSNKEENEVTEEELNKFKSAFKKKEFRKLFSNYCEDLADPEYRKETGNFLINFLFHVEEYLESLESKDQEKEGLFVRPDTWCVLICEKVVENSEHKENEPQQIFINLCTHQNLNQPSSLKNQWQVPYAMGTQRYELDSSGQRQLTYDIVFSPIVKEESINNSAKFEIIKQIATDAVLNKLIIPKESYSVKLWTKVKCFGSTPALIRLKPKEIKTKQVIKKKKEDNTKKESVPKCTLTHRGKFEMSEYIEGERVSSIRPKELVLKVDLDGVKKASGIDIEMEKNRITVKVEYEDKKAVFLKKNERMKKYNLVKDLPYSIVEKDSKATFDVDNEVLTVVLDIAIEKLDLNAHINERVQNKKYSFEEDLNHHNGNA